VLLLLVCTSAVEDSATGGERILRDGNAFIVIGIVMLWMVLVSEFVSNELSRLLARLIVLETTTIELKSNDTCKKHQGSKRDVEKGKLKRNSFPLSAQNLANSDYR
jgi:hypothetical protein